MHFQEAIAGSRGPVLSGGKKTVEQLASSSLPNLRWIILPSVWKYIVWQTREEIESIFLARYDFASNSSALVILPGSLLLFPMSDFLHPFLCSASLHLH